ncbi:hypothetical protein HMPREF2692_06810 [Corynebacterium sp. HMSC036D03]|uniref:hypothetical protein n=1 Tax=Corynebacterium sp. HMSC036D03 TaxID=1715171 RepID=UPI0008A9DD97|nr:hypothetical protein [Corynebacterium sp. HMSC036D03]OHO67066.1 hypothetical protein HMPREF2692_06810 [Corynebacterium sp. HMSC036D03]
MSEIVQAVTQALHAYGEAARNDYYTLDGKQIQRDMWTLANALESSDTYTVGELIEQLGITETDLGYEWI